MQILAIDLGTETLPALALGREPAEPGLMERPPRRRTQNVIDKTVLLRAWGVLGGVSAVLVLLAFGLTLHAGGWQVGDPVDSGPLHDVWRQATTMTFLGIVACQLGTGLAARSQRASLREIGLTSNRLLLWGFAAELVFTAALVTVPWLQDVFGTSAPRPWQLALLVPFPFIVWGVDELWRWRLRSKDPTSQGALAPGDVLGYERTTTTNRYLADQGIEVVPDVGSSWGAGGAAPVHDLSDPTRRRHDLGATCLP